MSDLISRGDAIKAVLVSNFSACTVFGRSEEGMATAKELIQVIKNLPSVQPEIIRCKDCKYYRPMIDQDDLCDYRQMQVFSDDYCSRAEPYKGEQK